MTNTQRIDAIAFDWGGIFTVNTFDSSAVRNLAALYDVDEERVARTYFPLMEEFEAGAFPFGDFVERFHAHAGLESQPDAFRTTFLGSVRERPEMYDLLASIPERYRVGMLSNNVAELCDTVRDDPRMKRVERFVFSNEIRVRKPDAAAFAALTDALGVPPERTVFVDDNEANIAACNALGYRGILLDRYDAFARRWNETLPDLAIRPAAQSSR